MNVKGFKKIEILGFGKEGQSAYHYVRSLVPGVPIIIADEHEIHEHLSDTVKEDPNVSFRFGNNALVVSPSSDLVIKSPGIPLSRVVYDETKTTLTTPTNIFLSSVKGKVIGVTGTKGKSTTSSLIYQILTAAGLDAYLIGNIGMSALDFLNTDHEKAYFVFEMSSYQCDTLIESPEIAVILNIFPEHIKYHGSFDAYLQAKANITRYQDEDDLLVIPQAPMIRQIEHMSHARKMHVSSMNMQADAYIKDGWLYFHVQKIAERSLIHLQGEHLDQTLLAAICVAKELQIENQIIRDAIYAMKPLAHRLEKVAVSHGITFYDDSLATIPQATVAALTTIKGVSTLIIGGLNRGEEIRQDILVGHLIAHPVKTLIVFPETGTSIAQLLREANYPNQIIEVQSMKEAVSHAMKETPKDAVCLHSPGAPSFNLFKDYIDRSNQYKKEIELYD